MTLLAENNKTRHLYIEMFSRPPSRGSSGTPRDDLQILSRGPRSHTAYCASNLVAVHLAPRGISERFASSNFRRRTTNDPPGVVRATQQAKVLPRFVPRCSQHFDLLSRRNLANFHNINIYSVKQNDTGWIGGEKEFYER